MILKKNMKETVNKSGSYIVEAAMTLPILIIAVTAFLIIIIIISICESICFYSAMEMKEAALRAYSINETVSLCKTIEKNVADSCDRLSHFNVTKSKYLFWNRNMEVYDLILVEGEADFIVENPVGISGEMIFKEKILARGFTGAMQDSYGLGEESFRAGTAKAVWIFPRYGEKYHSESCFYIKNAEEDDYIESIQQEDAIRKGYEACLVCGGR